MSSLTSELTHLEAAVVRSDAALVSLEPSGLDAGALSTRTLDPLVPALEDLDLATILQALSDPIRLRIVVELADDCEHTCGSFNLPVVKSTCSHHFRVLREAGVVAQRIDGKCRFNRLRREQLEQRFPGLLDAVLQASDA